MSHLNMAEIEELKSIMEDAFSELVSTFVNDSEMKLELLTKAIAEQDAESIRQIAHSLKGSSSNISAQPLSEIYKQIENMGKDGAIDGVEPLLTDAQTEFQAVRSALESL